MIGRDIALNALYAVVELVCAVGLCIDIGNVEDCTLDGALLRTRHGEQGHQQSDGSEKGLETPAIPGFKTTR